jgi:hypothetical protein
LNGRRRPGGRLDPGDVLLLALRHGLHTLEALG